MRGLPCLSGSLLRSEMVHYQAGPAVRARGVEWWAELAVEVVVWCAAGESGAAIAEELGLKRGRFYAFLRERGWCRR